MPTRGGHVNALLKDPKTYEHIESDLLGNRRRVLISELSGMSNLLYKYKELNLQVDQQSPEGRRILEEIKNMENQGFQFEGRKGSLNCFCAKPTTATGSLSSWKPCA